ncbi:MAG: riboflavin synthase [Flavobacteriales bacterium]|nr:MAG: riboflavin synthase [Flavobacteriales bacterium]
MFTGIIEEVGTVEKLEKGDGNLHITVRASFISELKIDQSIAHNGICLTVVELNDDCYTVTAIEETLSKTNLGDLKEGVRINLERCIKAGDRLDGHIVQGHIDCTATVKFIEEKDGSWVFGFKYNSDNVTVEKGSICVNGASLTVVDSAENYFSVAVIPYTFENTNFQTLKEDGKVNLEFDIIGKYVAKLLSK